MGADASAAVTSGRIVRGQAAAPLPALTAPTASAAAGPVCCVDKWLRLWGSATGGVQTGLGVVSRHCPAASTSGAHGFSVGRDRFCRVAKPWGSPADGGVQTGWALVSELPPPPLLKSARGSAPPGQNWASAYDTSITRT